MTIFEAYNKAKKKLADAGIRDNVFEAKEIIKHITGLNSAQILSNYTRVLTEFEETNWIAILKQREIRYPLQYIFGKWDFYGRSFYVGPGVLVPRPDTETVIEECLEFLKTREKPTVLDLCAGSGCIGITLAKEVADSSVVMAEKYDEALRYAIKNTEYNKAENAVALKGDAFEGTFSEGSFDLVVSNPPYIPEEERRLMYVAVTRAKEKLFLVNSRMRTLFGKEQSNPASRFISEIEDELLDKAYKEKENEKPKVNKDELFHKENMDYVVGDFVYHDVFGQGKIIELSGSIATIAFKHPHGIKKLMKNHKSIKKI